MSVTNQVKPYVSVCASACVNIMNKLTTQAARSVVDSERLIRAFEDIRWQCLIQNFERFQPFVEEGLKASGFDKDIVPMVEILKGTSKILPLSISKLDESGNPSPLSDEEKLNTIKEIYAQLRPKMNKAQDLIEKPLGRVRDYSPYRVASRPDWWVF